MDEESYISFEEYYKQGTQIDRRTTSEILKEVEEIIKMEWEVD